MPQTVVAQLLYVPTMLGQRLLRESYTMAKEVRFRLVEDDVVILFSGFVALMEHAEGSCYIRLTEPEKLEWKKL